jgi:hypothetical protein
MILVSAVCRPAGHKNINHMMELKNAHLFLDLFAWYMCTIGPLLMSETEIKKLMLARKHTTVFESPQPPPRLLLDR